MAKRNKTIGRLVLGQQVVGFLPKTNSYLEKQHVDNRFGTKRVPPSLGPPTLGAPTLGFPAPFRRKYEAALEFGLSRLHPSRLATNLKLKTQPAPGRGLALVFIHIYIYIYLEEVRGGGG